MSKIALSMICRGEGDEYKKLELALSSIYKHVDDGFITFTGDRTQIKKAEKVAKKYSLHISYGTFLWTASKDAVEWLTKFFGYAPHLKEGDKLFCFDEARNFNLAQIPQDEYPWVIWMDTDDVVRHGEKLRGIVEMGDQHNVDAFYFKYLYQVEASGDYVCEHCGTKIDGVRINHVLIEHLRERLVRNNGLYKWIAPIHETLIEQRPSNKTDNYDVDLVHLATDEDRHKSLTRNLKNLELAIYQSKGEDPRHIYYLAKAYFDIQTPEFNDKAVPLIIRYIYGDAKGHHSSGWPAERSQAWEYLCEIYRRKGEHDKSIKACLNALTEDPENPSIYLNLASSYMLKKEWERALFWVKISSAIPPKTAHTLVVNPKDTQARTLEIIFNCCVQLNKVDEAWAAAHKLLELFPKDQQIINSVNFIQGIRMQRETTKKVLELSNILKQTGERGKIKALLASTPHFIQDNPFIINLYQQNNPPKPWGEREIAIYCGMGFTNWSPRLMREPNGTFVGGSEEAVIMMSEALAKKGWKVTVYGDPGADEGEINGVNWLPYYKFNRIDNFNILIAWRDIRFFDTEFKAKKRFLWLHDIQSPIEFTKERVDRVDKVFFLSKWHRDNVPDLPDEKILLTSNGI